MNKWQSINIFALLMIAVSKAQELNGNESDEFEVVSNITTHRQFYVGASAGLFEPDEDYPIGPGTAPGTLPATGQKAKRYFIMRIIKLNWYQAFTYCKAKGMQLLSLDSEEANDKLKKYLRKEKWDNGDYWTSLNDLGEKNQYLWMSTGMPLSFSDWLINEPSHKQHSSCEDERCVLFQFLKSNSKHQGWNDVRCSNEFYFICEKITYL